MFNFLPTKYKKIASREYILRFLTLAFVLFSLLVIVSIILVLPAYFSIENRHAVALSEELQAANAVETNSANGLNATVDSISTYMNAAASLVPLYPETIAESVALARPSGVTISSISIGNTDQGVVASVIGTAGTRDELLAFVHSLEGVARFSNVDLPISYLAEDSNIDYSISISIKSLSTNQ